MGTLINSNGSICTTNNDNDPYGSGINANDLLSIANFYRNYFSVIYTPPSRETEILLSHWENLIQAIENGAGSAWSLNLPTIESGTILSTCWPIPKLIAFLGVINLSANTLNYNPKNDIIKLGWDQILPVAITINVTNGTIIGSSSTSTYSFTIDDSYPVNSYFTINNNGYIVGAGGKGGSADNTHHHNNASNPGSPGGSALYIGTKTYINNAGVIGGGGGGGSAINSQPYAYACSGGGGAGHIAGAGGGYNKSNCIGSAGTLLKGGAGGKDAFYGGDLGNNGGGWAGDGLNGTTYEHPGGTAGSAVSGTISPIWTNRGTVLGNSL